MHSVDELQVLKAHKPQEYVKVGRSLVGRI